MSWELVTDGVTRRVWWVLAVTGALLFAGCGAEQRDDASMAAKPDTTHGHAQWARCAAATPRFMPPPGSYPTTQSVAISDTTRGAKIYYTVDGTTPTTSSTLYGGPITVAATTTIRAIAVASGFSSSTVASATFTIQSSTPPPAAAAPSFTPDPGTTYGSAQSVTISDATPGATIYYTLDGTMPTTSSTPYTGPISVAVTTEITAMAVADGFTNSDVVVGMYLFPKPVAAIPAFTPAGGTYASAQSVTISEATAGATIYYTVDGTTPTTSSTQYTGPIAVAATTTIQAMAVASGYTSSNAAATYTIQGSPALPAVATPVFTPADGTNAPSEVDVQISDGTPGATIYYALGGGPWSLYTGPISITLPLGASGFGETIQAFAVATGFTNSGVASASYSVGGMVTTPGDPSLTGLY